MSCWVVFPVVLFLVVLFLVVHRVVYTDDLVSHGPGRLGLLYEMGQAVTFTGTQIRLWQFAFSVD